MNIPDACKRLSLGYATVYRLVLSGQLDARRDITGRWVIEPDSVERLARERAAAAREMTRRTADGPLTERDT